MTARLLELALALVLAGVVLLGVEAYLRWERFGGAALRRPLDYMAPSFRTADCLAPGPRGEIMRPGCTMRYKGATIRTNALGLNDRPVDESRPHFRVAVLGDSLTMAAGVATEDAYHALLERRLNAELGLPGFVELYNFGKGGRSTGQELRDLELAASLLPLDAAIVGVYRNDLWDNVLKREVCHEGDEALHPTEAERALHRRRHEGGNRLSAAVGVLERETGLWAFHRLYERLRAASLSREDGPRERARLDAMQEKALRLFRSCARGLRELADRHGLELAWATLDYAPHPHARLLEQELEALGETVLSMSDVHEAFADPAELVIYPGDGHPSAAVHARYAERLYRHLADLGWLERMRDARFRASPSGATPERSDVRAGRG